LEMIILGFPFSQRNGKGQGVIRQRACECEYQYTLMGMIENAFAHNRTVTECAIIDVSYRTAR